MKNNKSLITIILVAIIVFSGLIFSVYKLTTKKNNVFYASGYVSLCDSENSEKVYFKDSTSYKNGYNNQIIFENAEGEKQEVSKYSFAFYDDGSISFLTNGVILDLNGVTNSLIPYYNIKSNYIIDYNNSQYVIHSNDEDVILNNFIGRITDEKYIVAGNNIKLKLSSSNEYINGQYFELNFIDGENVKIDGKEINVQTISEESYIMVGENIKIDLATKKIIVNGETKLDLNEIIIDNDANIDIKYEDIFNEDNNSTNENKNGESSNNNSEKEKTIDNKNNDNNNEEKNVETRYETETVTEYKSVPYIELLSSYTGDSKISLQFKVIDDNGLIKDKKITVKYLKINDKDATSKKIEYDFDGNPINFVAEALTSNSKYLVTITTSYVKNNVVFNDYILFQRTFETKDIGISLERDYLTSSSITYNIISDSDSEYTSAKLNIYNASGEIIDSQTFNNNKSSQLITIAGLQSNTKYTAKIEDVVYGYITNTGVLTQRNDTTLKYNPFKDGILESQPEASVSKKDNNYKINIGDIKDKDNAIKEVVYKIYEVSADENTSDSLVKTIKKETVGSFTKTFDDEITTHKIYYYIATVLLNDNEKNIEYELIQSNKFSSDAKQSPTAEFKSTSITTTTIKGQFIVNDKDNTIDNNQRVYITYTSATGDSDSVDVVLSHENCDSEAKESLKCANVNLVNLNSNDVYTLGLHAYVDYNDENLTPAYELIGAIKVNTQEATIVRTEFLKRELLTSELTDDEKTTILNKLMMELFEIELEFKLDLTDEKNVNVMKNMSSFEAYLFEGTNPNTGELIGTMSVGSETNIADTYFNQTSIDPEKEYTRKVLTIEDFGLTASDLIKNRLQTGIGLSADYTIVLAEGKSGGNDIVFKESTFHFQIEEDLIKFAQNNVSVYLNGLINSSKVSGDRTKSSLKQSTVIGIKLTPNYENKKYTDKIYYKVYDVTDRTFIDKDGYQIKMTKSLLSEKDFSYVSFTYEVTNRDEIKSTNIWFPDLDDKNFKIDNLFDSDAVITDFTLQNYDNENVTEQNFFRRGRVYYATIQVGIDGMNNKFPLDGEVGANDELIVYKQAPEGYIYPYKSYSNLTNGLNNDYVYKYKIESDVDNSLIKNSNENYDDYLYYTKGTYYNGIDEYSSKKYTCKDVNGFNCALIEDIEPNGTHSLILTPVLVDRKEIHSNAVVLNTYNTEKVLNVLNATYSVVKNNDNNNIYNNLFVIQLEEQEEDILNKVGSYSASIKLDGVEQLKISNITDLVKIDYPFNSLIINDLNDNKWTYVAKTTKDSDLFYAAYVDACPSEDENATNKCIYIDYSILYNSSIYSSLMKTLIDKELTIEISALYDDGKIAFDHTNSLDAYAFQIYYPIVKEVSDADRSYFISNNYATSMKISKSNLNGVYTYPGVSSSSYGFIENNKRITIKNKYYKDSNNAIKDISKLYSISSLGVTIPNGSGTYPFVIKSMSNSQLAVTAAKTNITSFNKIVPTLKIESSSSTVDGAKFKFNLTGNDEKHGEYVYFNVTDENTTNETIIVDKEILRNTRTITVNGSESVLSKTTIDSDSKSTFDRFSLDITSLKGIDNGDTYSYDYLTGIIKFYTKLNNEYVLTDKYDGQTISVEYVLSFNNFESNITYKFNAYMLNNSNKKIYLAKQASEAGAKNIYDEFTATFTTIELNTDKYINNPKINIDSYYDKRVITLEYNIKDIVGIKNLSYVLNSDENTTYTLSNDNNETYKYLVDDKYCYYKTSDTCYVKENNSYKAYVHFNVVDHEDNEFIYGTNYKILINNENIDSLNSVSVRELELPTVTVAKYSTIKENVVYNLKYDLKIDDPDHVIINSGAYTVYLEKLGNDGVEYQVSNNTLDTKLALDGQIAKNFEYEKELYNALGQSITPKNLDAETAYYFTIKYNVYRNNAALEVKDQTETKKYLNYTLSNDGYSLGIHEFNINKESSSNYLPVLKFGYATNFEACEENGTKTCEQDSYLVGINYTIANMDKESSSQVITESLYLFLKNGKLSKMNNGTSSSRLGSNYYQLTLKPFLMEKDVTATYKITYRMWYATYDNTLNTESGCDEENNIDRHWDSETKLCYILSNITYSDTTNYEGGTK